METKVLIGSHLDLSQPNYLLGTVQKALAYNETTFQCYTGAPQNSARIPVERFFVEEAHKLMKESGIDPNKVIVHAPYIINIGNPINDVLYEISKKFLASEIKRVQQMGFKTIVLHPGCHVNGGSALGITRIINALNEIFSQDDSDVVVALETMAGKGTEIGSLEEIKMIIDGIQKKERIGVCLDTCHMSDYGYDLLSVDEFLAKVDEVVGLHYVRVVHINDSKNPVGSHKDRHENIGFGQIGFEKLYNIVHHEALKDIPKILETPYINKKAPYREEIEMLLENKFNAQLKDLFQ